MPAGRASVGDRGALAGGAAATCRRPSPRRLLPVEASGLSVGARARSRREQAAAAAAPPAPVAPSPGLRAAGRRVWPLCRGAGALAPRAGRRRRRPRPPAAASPPPAADTSGLSVHPWLRARLRREQQQAAAAAPTPYQAARLARRRRPIKHLPRRPPRLGRSTRSPALGGARARLRKQQQQAAPDGSVTPAEPPLSVGAMGPPPRRTTSPGRSAPPVDRPYHPELDAAPPPARRPPGLSVGARARLRKQQQEATAAPPAGMPPGLDPRDAEIARLREENARIQADATPGSLRRGENDAGAAMGTVSAAELCRRMCRARARLTQAAARGRRRRAAMAIAPPLPPAAAPPVAPPPPPRRRPTA